MSLSFNVSIYVMAVVNSKNMTKLGEATLFRMMFVQQQL